MSARTGRSTRAGWSGDFGHEHFGAEGYAREELVAELGSASLFADLELTPQVRDDHASYIASWLEVLKSSAEADADRLRQVEVIGAAFYTSPAWGERSTCKDRCLMWRVL